MALPSNSGHLWSTERSVLKHSWKLPIVRASASFELDQMILIQTIYLFVRRTLEYFTWLPALH